MTSSLLNPVQAALLLSELINRSLRFDLYGYEQMSYGTVENAILWTLLESSSRYVMCIAQAPNPPLPAAQPQAIEDDSKMLHSLPVPIDNKPFTIAGHKFGGVIACKYFQSILESQNSRRVPPLVYTFGSPRVEPEFAHKCKTMNIEGWIYRYVHRRDPVPKINFLDDETEACHLGKEILIGDSQGGLTMACNSVDQYLQALNHDAIANR